MAHVPDGRAGTTQEQAADLPLDGLTDLEGAAVSAKEQALADVEALLLGGVEAAGEALEVVQVGVDGALGGRYGPHLAQDGGVVAVLEADPEALVGDVGRRQRLGLVGGDGGRVGRPIAAARDEGQEARAVHGQGHAEVVLGVGDRGYAQAGLGRVPQVRGHVDHVCYTHLGRWETGSYGSRSPGLCVVCIV